MGGEVMYSHFNSFSSSPSFIALLAAQLSESYEDLVLSLFPFPPFLWKTNSFYCHVYRREEGKALTSSLLSPPPSLFSPRPLS